MSAPMEIKVEVTASLWSFRRSRSSCHAVHIAVGWERR